MFVTQKKIIFLFSAFRKEEPKVGSIDRTTPKETGRISEKASRFGNNFCNKLHSRDKHKMLTSILFEQFFFVNRQSNYNVL
jgi:hypothetical protein